MPGVTPRVLTLGGLRGKPGWPHAKARALWPASKWLTRRCWTFLFCLSSPAWIILKGRRGQSQLAFPPPHSLILTSTDGRGISEMPRVLTLRLSRQTGRWRSRYRKHKIWPCENSFCKCRDSRHRLNLAALLQAAYFFLGTTMSWNKSHPGSRISSQHMDPKTKRQSLEATESLLQKSLAAKTKKKTTPYTIHWKYNLNLKYVS